MHLCSEVTCSQTFRRAARRVAGLLVLFTTLFPSGLFPQDVGAVQGVPADTLVAYPVTLNDEVLFSIRHGVLGWTPEVRALSIQQRLEMVAEDESVSPDSIIAVEAEGATEVVVGGRLVVAVSDKDAASLGRSRQDVANDYVLRIQQALGEYRAERSARGIATGVGVVAVATAVFVLLLWFFRRLFRRILAVAEGKVKSIQIGESEVVQAAWISRGIASVLRLLRVFAVVVLVYLYFQLVLAQFPWTRPFARGLLDVVLVPLNKMVRGVEAEIPSLIFLAVLGAVTFYVVRFIRFFFEELEKGTVKIPGFDDDWSRPTYKIVRFLVLAFAVVVAFPYIPGSSSPAFQGVSIFFGVLFSLGSSSAVANVVAGVILTYMRAFKAGDVVMIGESRGRVVATGLLVTRISTPKNVQIAIPNSMVLSSHVTNFSSQARERKLILHTSVTIGYDTPWRQVHALLRLAAERTPGLLKEPAPFVLQTALNDFYITYELNAYTDHPELMLQTYSDLHKNIQDAFNEHGVQIMSPNYEADRAVPTVVPKERWYAAPAVPPGQPGADT